jgi:uncharacterized membrane-anchored protein
LNQAAHLSKAYKFLNKAIFLFLGIFYKKNIYMHKNTFRFLGFLFISLLLSAKDDNPLKQDSLQLQILNYDTTGSVTIGDGIAKFDIPAGFKFLNAKQSIYVLHDLWGNPPSSETLGMIFPSEAGPIVPASWAIEVTYEESGHVKDDDAKDIKYDELLKNMQSKMEGVNGERKKAGYPTVQLLGWASPPFYDQQSKKLHWAKRLQFEGDSTETLNYNIRILGRKGVLVLNAIGSMEQLDEIKASINPILSNVNFTEGHKYAQFDSNIDKVAAYGIGGLIAGGVLLKSGLLAKIGIFLLKFIKPVLLGAAAVGGSIWRFITGKKKDDSQAA